MAKVRWTGEGDREVMVEVDGKVEQVEAARLAWVEVPIDVARNLNQQDGWELESVRKAARTRAEKDGE